MSQQKRGGIYDIENIMDIHSKVDELSQKLDHLLNIGYSSTLPNLVQDICALCASPSHFISECPTTPHSPEFVCEQVQQAQTQQACRLENDPYLNTYNPSWRNHPNFF